MHRLRRVVPGPPLAIREVDALARAVAGQMPGHCELHGNCAGGFYTIEPDGSVGQCDKFVDTPHYALGSLGDGGFDELRTGEAVSRLRAAEAEEDRAMQSCPHHARCRGWCPHERMVAGGPDRRSAPCCGLAPVFDALLADAAERRPLEAR